MNVGVCVGKKAQNRPASSRRPSTGTAHATGTESRAWMCVASARALGSATRTSRRATSQREVSLPSCRTSLSPSGWTPSSRAGCSPSSSTSSTGTGKNSRNSAGNDRISCLRCRRVSSDSTPTRTTVSAHPRPASSRSSRRSRSSSGQASLRPGAFATSNLSRSIRRQRGGSRRIAPEFRVNRSIVPPSASSDLKPSPNRPIWLPRFGEECELSSAPTPSWLSGAPVLAT